MSETPLTQQMIDTPVGNGTEKRGLYAFVSRHPLVAGGLVLAGAGVAYAVGRLVTASQDGVIARTAHDETSSEGSDNVRKRAGTDQQRKQPQDRRFEKAKTGAAAVTGNVEQGPPQQESSSQEDGNKPAIADEAKQQSGSRRPETKLRIA